MSVVEICHRKVICDQCGRESAHIYGSHEYALTIWADEYGVVRGDQTLCSQCAALRSVGGSGE